MVDKRPAVWVVQPGKVVHLPSLEIDGNTLCGLAISPQLWEYHIGKVRVKRPSVCERCAAEMGI